MRALLKKLDQEAAAQEGRPVLLIYTNVRSVSEMGDAFDGLTNLRAIRRKRHFVVIAMRPHASWFRTDFGESFDALHVHCVDFPGFTDKMAPW